MDKTWDAFNRLATETNARGIVKTRTYEQARGLLVGISYSDATPGQSFAYNPYGELETDNLRVGNHTHLITEKKTPSGAAQATSTRGAARRSTP